MANTFRARVAHKRDTSANWTAANPVLLNGELIIVDTDAGYVRCKIGDGEKKYTQLPFNDEAMKNLVDSKANISDLDNAVNRIADNEAAIAANTSAIDSFKEIASEDIHALFNDE